MSFESSNNLTPLGVAHDIQNRIQAIEESRARLKVLAKKKGEALKTQKKNLAIALLRLKNEDVKTWEGQEVGKIPASMMVKVAEGINSQYMLEYDLAESAYKCEITDIDAFKAQLNGFQSINRHLDTTGEPFKPAF